MCQVFFFFWFHTILLTLSLSLCRLFMVTIVINPLLSWWFCAALLSLTSSCSLTSPICIFDWCSLSTAIVDGELISIAADDKTCTWWRWWLLLASVTCEGSVVASMMTGVVRLLLMLLILLLWLTWLDGTSFDDCCCWLDNEICDGILLMIPVRWLRRFPVADRAWFVNNEVRWDLEMYSKNT